MPFRLIVHNIGNVDSIGNAVFLAGVERYACASSTFMFHGVGFDTKAARFEEKMLREMLAGLLADQKRIAAVVAGRTNMNADEVVQGEGFNEFCNQVKQYFNSVSIRKPKASRSRSNEVYILAKGFK